MSKVERLLLGVEVEGRVRARERMTLGPNSRDFFSFFFCFFFPFFSPFSSNCSTQLKFVGRESEGVKLFFFPLASLLVWCVLCVCVCVCVSPELSRELQPDQVYLETTIISFTSLSFCFVSIFFLSFFSFCPLLGEK